MNKRTEWQIIGAGLFLILIDIPIVYDYNTIAGIVYSSFSGLLFYNWLSKTYDLFNK